MMQMIRRVVFSAAVADWNDTLTPDANRERYGIHASPEPYGHNYLLDVGVAGEIDPRTGMLINIKELDRIVRAEAVQHLDRKFINRNVADFRERAVTPEILAEWIAARVEPRLPETIALASVRLEETPERFAEWRNSALTTQQTRRRNEKTMLLTHAYEFSASHRLHSPHLTPEANRELYGKCNYDNGHGHNYIVEITVAGPINADSGRVIDPETLDAIARREVVDRYDHRHFNLDIPEFQGLIPSAEVITRVIWDRLREQIPAPARLARVVVRETARNIFEYAGEEDN